MKGEDKLRNEKVPTLLLKLSMPAVAAMLVNAIYNLVDTYFVGQLGDDVAMGAVTIAFPIFMAIAAFGQTVGIGAGVSVSRYLGEKRKDKAEEVASTSIVVSTIIGIGIMVVAMIFIDDILTLSGARGSLHESSKDYLVYILYGALFVMLNMNLNNLIRAEGNSLFSMIAITTGAVLNVILDPILIFKMEMGVAGASLATTIAQGISTLLLISYYLSKKNVIELSIKKVDMSLKKILAFLKPGLPSLTRQLLTSTSMTLINRAVVPFGDSTVAAMGIILRVGAFASYILYGVAQGFQPVVAFNFGAKAIDRVKEAIRYTFINVGVFCIFVSIFFFFSSEVVIAIFTQNKETLEIGIRSMSYVLIFFIGGGAQIIITTLFQALGEDKKALFLSLTRQGIFFIPTLMVLPKLFDFRGVIYTFVVADVLSFIASVILFISYRKKLKRQGGIKS